MTSRSYFPLPWNDVAACLSTQPCALLLDCARPQPDRHHSTLFLDPVRILSATGSDRIKPLLHELEQLRRTKKCWIAGYLHYEAAHALEPRLALPEKSIRRDAFPLAWFGIYESALIFDHCSGTWNTPLPACSPASAAPHSAPPPQLVLQTTPQAYRKCIARIHELISAGDTYQINYTFDATVSSTEPDVALYGRLRRMQPTPYCALLRTAEGTILSFSPELFFSLRGRSITVRPMKGTAARAGDTDSDRKVRDQLAADEKNRAENVMIVDLLRNDLGRICTTGSVRVTSLCSVETHPTLHQMTSTVQGRLRPATTLTDLFTALFPCGSVTGAPKIRSMQIIHELEQGPRGVYCGALGYFGPDGRAVFSVPIRTLIRAAKAPHWRYRVGSGIVADSRAGTEYAECCQKCSFITHVRPPFQLVETMLANHGTIRLLHSHLRRLQASSRYFAFPWEPHKLRQRLDEVRHILKKLPAARLRLLIDEEGTLQHEISRLMPPRSTLLVPAPHPVDIRTPFLYHKTTFRPWYAQAMQAIAEGRCFDTLFFNTHGELTEGAISNLFVRIDSILYTPPVHCGLLPGTLRAHLLTRGHCCEKVLTRDDLDRTDEIYCGNSVRGLVRVTLAGTPLPAAAGRTDSGTTRED